MPTTEGSDAEGRLSRQIENMNVKLDTLIQGYGKVSNEMEHLADTAKASEQYGNRLTIVETKAETNEKWIQRSGDNNRWLIALCIGTLLGVIGLAFKVLGH